MMCVIIVIKTFLEGAYFLHLNFFHVIPNPRWALIPLVLYICLVTKIPMLACPHHQTRKSRYSFGDKHNNKKTPQEIFMKHKQQNKQRKWLYPFTALSNFSSFTSLEKVLNYAHIPSCNPSPSQWTVCSSFCGHFFLIKRDVINTWHLTSKRRK